MFVRLLTAVCIVVALSSACYAADALLDATIRTVIGEVRIEAPKGFSRKRILARMKTKVGKDFSRECVLDDMWTICELGHFKPEQLSATPTIENGNLCLTFKVEPKRKLKRHKPDAGDISNVPSGVRFGRELSPQLIDYSEMKKLRSAFNPNGSGERSVPKQQRKLLRIETARLNAIDRMNRYAKGEVPSLFSTFGSERCPSEKHKTLSKGKFFKYAYETNGDGTIMLRGVSQKTLHSVLFNDGNYDVLFHGVSRQAPAQLMPIDYAEYRVGAYRAYPFPI